MTINEITEQECRAVLARNSIGMLCCSYEDQPYVVPVSFAYEHDYIYVFSTLGQKIEWMRANPKVCVAVNEIADQSQWVSVIVNGTYDELKESHNSVERAHARMLLGQQHHFWLNALAERRAKGNDLAVDPIFFRVRLLSMSGLRATGDGQISKAINR